MILQVGPYCLRPGELMCQLRLIVPPAVFTLLLAKTYEVNLLLGLNIMAKYFRAQN